MKKSITSEDIDKIINEATIVTTRNGEKTTVVVVTLRNGFVIVESSSCVDPANYNEVMGKYICLDRVKNKLWELEGYRLQCELAKGK